MDKLWVKINSRSGRLAVLLSFRVGHRAAAYRAIATAVVHVLRARGPVFTFAPSVAHRDSTVAVVDLVAAET